MGATERGMCREERETMYLRGGGGCVYEKKSIVRREERLCVSTKRGGGVYEKINSEMEHKMRQQMGTCSSQL